MASINWPVHLAVSVGLLDGPSSVFSIPIKLVPRLCGGYAYVCNIICLLLLTFNIFEFIVLTSVQGNAI